MYKSLYTPLGKLLVTTILRFCGWCRVFAHNRPGRDNARTQSDLPGAEPAAKCDVYNCLLIGCFDWDENWAVFHFDSWKSL